MRFTLIPNAFQRPHVVELASALAEHGLSFDLIGSDQYVDLLNTPGISFLQMMGSVTGDQGLLRKLARDFRYFIQLLVYTRRTENRVFHYLWFRHPFLEGIVMTLLLKMMGKKVVYTAFNLLPHDSDNLYLRIVFRTVYRLVDQIVVLTPALKRTIMEQFAVPSEKIAVVERGLYRISDSQDRTPRTERQRLGLGDEDRVLLLFGKIAAYKGLDIALEAHARASEKIGSLKLIVAGQVFGSFRDTFDRLAAAYASPNVQFRPDHVPGSEVETYFKAADVVLLPYLEGSQSGVMFLAYAYGRPVIASDIGNFPSDVVLGRTGLRFGVGDASALEKAIITGYESGFLGANGASIAAYANDRYSWSRAAAKLEALYRKLAS